MLTTKLWRILRQPPENHVMAQKMDTFPIGRYVLWGAVLTPILSIMMLNSPIPDEFYISLLCLFSPVLSLPFILVMVGTIFGLISAIDISRVIIASSVDEPIETPPKIALSNHWLIAHTYLHRDHTFTRIFSRWLWIPRIFLPLIFILLFSITKNDAPLPGNEFWSLLLAFPLMLIINDYQSMILGVLTGIMSPAVASRRFYTGLFAATQYVIVQTSSYSIAILTIGILGIIHPLPDESSLARVLLHTGMIVVAFALIREIAIFTLWRVLLRRLNTNLDEVPSLLDWSS